MAFIVSVMATDEQLRAADTRIRALLRDADLPDPDEVEYGEDEVVLLWHETKTAVVVEIDGAGEGDVYHA